MPRADAPAGRARRRGGRPARMERRALRGVGAPAARDVRRGGTRPLLRPARPRRVARAAVRRAPLGPRGEHAARRQLAGAGRASVLHGDRRGSAGRDAAPPLPRGGPNPVFMDYISHVLPMLGEDRVEQRAIDELGPGVDATRRDSDEVARAKGDVAMADAIAAEVLALPRPTDEMIGARVDGAFLYLEPHDIARLIGETQTEARSYNDARERFRTLLVRELYLQYGNKLGGAAFRSFDELESGLRRDGLLNKWLDAIWPRVKPEQIVRRIVAEFPRGRGWSDADLPLLDEARALLEGAPKRYGHVIVDEAQDLTPMQLRMLARRSVGPMTILGDIAQAAGVVGYHRWEDVLGYVATEGEVTVEELRLAYRVPRQVMEL